MPFSWSSIQKPVVAFAPMSGVSDIAMRSIARRWGSDITFSEFISADALYYKVKGYLKITEKGDVILNDADVLACAADDAFWVGDKSMMLAKFIEEERPFIIQLFGPTPEHFAVAAKILAYRFKPDGFDINFGCPARSVIHNGAGSCLFLDPARAKRIIETVKESSGGLPTSIKLRASYQHVSAIEFLDGITGAPFENVTVHMRTYEQVHHGQPNWDMGKEIKNYFKDTGITVIVNGGIDSGLKAKEVLEYTGADGVMVAQASLGNPFIFAQMKAAINGTEAPVIDMQTKISTVLDHARLMAEHKGAHGMLEMRKHLLWYFKGYPNASQLRAELSKVTEMPQLEEILSKLLVVA